MRVRSSRRGATGRKNRATKRGGGNYDENGHPHESREISIVINVAIIHIDVKKDLSKTT